MWCAYTKWNDIPYTRKHWMLYVYKADYVRHLIWFFNSSARHNTVLRAIHIIYCADGNDSVVWTEQRCSLFKKSMRKTSIEYFVQRVIVSHVQNSQSKKRQQKWNHLVSARTIVNSSEWLWPRSRHLVVRTNVATFDFSFLWKDCWIDFYD